VVESGITTFVVSVIIMAESPLTTVSLSTMVAVSVVAASDDSVFLDWQPTAIDNITAKKSADLTTDFMVIVNFTVFTG
jgi:type IV secretory pathway TrbF-like protein